jgi:hypothetical protein
MVISTIISFPTWNGLLMPGMLNTPGTIYQGRAVKSRKVGDALWVYHKSIRACAQALKLDPQTVRKIIALSEKKK